MTYAETCNWLFNLTANYESQGKNGYKPGLETMLKLDEHYDMPHQNFKSIHIAGTNGKGSVSHTLASFLQVCGYRVGLYTSPHLLDFSERIRINGMPIDENYVVNFVEEDQELFKSLGATFFEITTIMAFKYFSDNDVDIAIIEVGLGGRLDSTNIITPILSIITNISLDHTQLLGNSVEMIALEKGGIIKPEVPVVIGETQPETRSVFKAIAAERNAPIVFAEEDEELLESQFMPDDYGIYYKTLHYGEFKGQLCGHYQANNTRTILCSLHELMKLDILCQPTDHETEQFMHRELSEAFLHVCDFTGLKGRWQTVHTSPTVICDIGHNVAAWQYLSLQLEAVKCKNMHIIFGMLDDKDIYNIMSMLPKNATYYFTKANTKRALPEQSLMVFGQQFGLNGSSYPDVASAYSAAIKVAEKEDFIFVGGSNYVVAEFLKSRV